MMESAQGAKENKKRSCGQREEMVGRGRGYDGSKVDCGVSSYLCNVGRVWWKIRREGVKKKNKKK